MLGLVRATMDERHVVEAGEPKLEFIPDAVDALLPEFFGGVTLTWAPSRLQRGPTPGGVRGRVGIGGWTKPSLLVPPRSIKSRRKSTLPPVGLIK